MLSLQNECDPSKSGEAGTVQRWRPHNACKKGCCNVRWGFAGHSYIQGISQTRGQAFWTYLWRLVPERLKIVQMVKRPFEFG